MTVWLPILISAAMLLIALVTLVRATRQEHHASAAQQAKMSADLSYIRASVDDIRTESRITRSDVKTLETRVSKAEASAASAHRRLDDHITKGGHP